MVTKKQGDGREDRATVKNGKRISKSIAERIQPEVEYSASKDLLAIIKDLVFALCNERIREPFLAESIISSLTNPPASCFGCLIDCLLMTGKHALADAIVTELLSKHLPREAKKSSNSLPKRRKSNAMSASILREEERSAHEAKQKMCNAASKANSVVANVLIGLAHGRRAKSALRVAKRGIARGFKLPQAGVWHAILNAAVGNTELGEQCWELVEKSGFHPTAETWTAFIQTKSLDADGAADALKKLHRMQQKKITITPDVCSAVLEHCVAGGNHDGTSKLLKIMKSRSMMISHEVFNRMIQEAVKSGAKSNDHKAALEQGMDILHFARSSGVRPDFAQLQGNHELHRQARRCIYSDNADDTGTRICCAGKRNNRRNKIGEGSNESSGSAHQTLFIDSDLCLDYVRSLSRGMEVSVAMDFVKSTMCAEGSGLVAGSAVWSSARRCAKSHDLEGPKKCSQKCAREAWGPPIMLERGLLSFIQPLQQDQEGACRHSEGW